MPSNEQPASATTGKWLSIVGIGENGVDGLGEEARSLISAAATVFGGRRHLELASPLITGEATRWPKPFDSTMAAVRALRGTPVCVLASGDPFMHGVGVTLARHIDSAEMHVVPYSSAFSLAAARLGWAHDNIDTISLHGRPIEYVMPLLHSGRRILALTSDASGPSEIAGWLVQCGFGKSSLIILEALGGPDEAVSITTAESFDLPTVNPLNLVAITVVSDRPDREIPLTPGLAETRFDHDGQITKHDVRALTLAALAPRRGELLWDIGAGAGSIAIEWMLRDPSLRAIAIERNSERAGRIRSNARSLGVPGLQIVLGEAPAALVDLPEPDAIFIGGGGSGLDTADMAVSRLRAGGRLVANAVTLEMEVVLLGLHDRLGGSLTRISIARAAPVGTLSGWRPAMPVTQWSWVKP